METKGQLFVVSSPSGTGKTTLCNAALNSLEWLKISTSYTTRKPRGDERNGVEYYFVEDDEFDRMIRDDEFVEWAEVHGNRYGTSEKKLRTLLENSRGVLFDIDVQGAANLRKRFPEAVLIFILPPSMTELSRRLRERKTDDPVEIQRRLRGALDEIERAKHYDYRVVNDDLDDAIRQMLAILTGQQEKAENLQEDIDRLSKEYHRLFSESP